NIATAAGTFSGAGSTGNIISIQGSVQLAGSNQISVGNSTGGAVTTLVGATSTFFSLADINVSTVNGTPAGTTGVDLNTQGGANQAISVVNFALQSLNNTGGQLGA